MADELGKLGGRKKGFFPVFERSREGNHLGFLPSIRKGFVDFFRGQFTEDFEIEELEVKKSNRRALPDCIHSKVKENL